MLSSRTLLRVIHSAEAEAASLCGSFPGRLASDLASPGPGLSQVAKSPESSSFIKKDWRGMHGTGP